MDSELLKAFLGEAQVRFVNEWKSVVEEKFLKDQPSTSTDVAEEDFEVLQKIICIAENVTIIIEQLKSARDERRKFIQQYPEGTKLYEECIMKLEEIAKIMEKDKFNCNISRMVGHCISFIGCALTLTSGVLVPFTAGLSTPFAIAGGTSMMSGSGTSFGASVAEKYRVNKLIKEAQKTITDNEECFIAMAGCLQHELNLHEALKGILTINIIKNVTPEVKDLVEKGMKIENRAERMDFIEKNACSIMKKLTQELAQSVPPFAVTTILSLLVALFVSLFDQENQFEFEHYTLHAKTILEIVSLSDEIFDWTTLVAGKVFIAKSVVKAVTRGTLGAVGMALDSAGIALTAYQIHKGSPCSQAEKVGRVADGLKKELDILQKVHDNLD